jgi:co-chaperonin GroES (HSP10)
VIKPEGYKVLVKPDDIEEVTEGGIILTPQTRDQDRLSVTRGEIVAIGPKANICFREDDPPIVGQRVIFAKYGGFVVEDNGEEYRILNDEDIVGLIE